MNRLKNFVKEVEGRPPRDDFWVVRADQYYHVTREIAEQVWRQVRRWWVPRWITFRDIYGSRVRIRGSWVRSITESTTGQRAAERAFDHARRAEERADKHWWEDD